MTLRHILLTTLLLFTHTVTYASQSSADGHHQASDAITAHTITVAVASNFLATARQLASGFESMSGHTVRIASGSSAKLYAQIRHGAPYQLFLSADQDKPRRLIQQNLAYPDSQVTYANGRLVLASVQHGQPALDQLTSKSIAIANPKLAPYGLAAQQTLEHLNAAKSARLITGENISQAYQFLFSGTVDYGLVALSQVLNNFPGRYIEIPASHYQPIRQDLVMLKTARPDTSDNYVAQQFVEYLRSTESQTLIRQAGYWINDGEIGEIYDH